MKLKQIVVLAAVALVLSGCANNAETNTNQNNNSSTVIQESTVKYPILSDNICKGNIESGFVEIEGKVVYLESKLEDVVQDSWNLNKGYTMDGFFSPDTGNSQTVIANQFIYIQVRQGADSRLGNAIVHRISSLSYDEEGKIVFPGGFYNGMSYSDVTAKLGQPNEEKKVNNDIWLTYVGTKYTYRFIVYSNNAIVTSIDYWKN